MTLAWITEELNTLKETGFFTNIRTLSSPQGAWLVVDGKKVLNFVQITIWDWPMTPAW